MAADRVDEHIATIDGGFRAVAVEARRTILDDPEGRLESSGKQMAHIALTGFDDIGERELRDWLGQVAALA